MMAEKKSSLRVLYTINSSPQYILARSHSLVQITLIPSLDAHGSLKATQNHQCPYANVSLKICLDTICRSSPELTHDSTRDFSLYVLDPLESNSAPAPVQINNSNGESSRSKNFSSAAAEQPRGVAVGLGLMSWALATDANDGMSVVGTLVRQTNGQEALEVIFALRETMAMKRPAWSMPSSSSQPSSSQESAASISMGSSQLESKAFLTNQTASSTVNLTRETLASIQMRTKPKVKAPKPARLSTVPVTESDKLMNADTFIGPMKKKGRPRTTNADTKGATRNGNAVASGSGSSNNRKEIIVIDGSDSDGTVPTPTNSELRRPGGVQDLTKKKLGSCSQHPTNPSFTTEPSDRRPSETLTNSAEVEVKTEPQEGLSLLDVLAYLSATSSSEPNAQNATLLAALSMIDSANGQGNATNPENTPNPALISALKQLLSVCPQPSTPAISASSQQSQSTRFTAPKSESDHGSNSLDSSIIIVDKENVNPEIYEKRNDKDGKGAKISDPPLASSSHCSQSERPAQRLSLGTRNSNEILSGRTSLKDSVLVPGKEKVVRKRTLSDFMDEKEGGKSKGKGKERERAERRDGHRHASSQRAPKVPATDVLRHYPRLIASAHPRSEQPSNYYRTPLECSTSPGRPRPDLDDGSPEEPVIATEPSKSQPASNAPSPTRAHRISASSPVRGTQQASRRKYVVPEWARTSTSTQPRLSEEAQRALEDLEEKKKLERAAARRTLSAMQSKPKKKVPAASTSKSDDATRENRPAVPDARKGPITGSDRPMFAAPNINFPFITTRSSSPPPNPTVIPKTPKTPTRDRHHLRPTSGQEGESLFTPIMQSGSLFGSARSQSLRTPLPSIYTSPLGNRKKAKLSPARSLLTGDVFSSSSTWSKLSALHSSEDSRTLRGSSKCLERGLEDDLDGPPSSLPIASSDIDINETHTQPTTEADIDVDIDDDGEVVPLKQHWPGLPPSSPPAPSSPMLLPESTTDDEMDDIPIATSDSETDAEMTPGESDSNTCNGDSPAYFDEQLTNEIANTDFSSFFPAIDGAAMDSESVMDIFQQFTHLNSDPDIFPSVDDSNAQVNPELEAIFQNGLEGIDFTEFWETFKPLINDSIQAPHEESTAGQENWYDVGKVDLPTFGEVDHAKLADDMQALLSGCLM